MNTNKTDLLKNFEAFVKRDIEAAIGELEKIDKEENRSHLQKLVYIDLVNRFDYLIDQLLLVLSSKSKSLNDIVIEGWKDIPVTKKDLFQILTQESIQDTASKQIEDEIKIRYLNRRHADKLSILLRECFSWSDSDLKRPRVDTNGTIFEKMDRSDRKNPLQVPGFADWLYSRRNAFVHGSGNKFLQTDIDAIQKKYGVKVGASAHLRLLSIRTASKFYLDLCKKMREEN